jgi:hypothetical protein
LLDGIRQWLGQPCQKQPSTKTASRCRRKTKSGLPGNEGCRRQPVNPLARGWAGAKPKKNGGRCRVAALLKRWILGTHQGAVRAQHLDYYLDEFTFRFNRRRPRHAINFSIDWCSRRWRFRQRLTNNSAVAAPSRWGRLSQLASPQRDFAIHEPPLVLL